ncbi:MAG: hypothetical protein WDZ90_01620 [Candidatus Paceibacterota bacterium]
MKNRERSLMPTSVVLTLGGLLVIGLGAVWLVDYHLLGGKDRGEENRDREEGRQK